MRSGNGGRRGVLQKTEFHQGKLYVKTLVDAGFIPCLTLCTHRKGVIKEFHGTSARLLIIAFLQGIGEIEQSLQPRSLADKKVAKMGTECGDEILGIETLCKDFVKSEQSPLVIPRKRSIHDSEAIFIVQHIEIAAYILILHISPAESNSLVKNSQCITHRSVGFLCNYMQTLIPYLYIFLFRNSTQIAHYVANRYSIEIVGLTTRKYRWENFVFLRRRKYENRVCRRFLKSFEKSVESLLRQHVHLVYYIYAVLPDLRRDLYLLEKRLYIVHSVVGSGVQLMNAIRATLLERNAGLAFAARLHLRARPGTVDCLCENAGGARFAHSAWTAEQVCVRELSPRYGIAKGLRNIVLTYKRFESIRSVLPCGNYIL